jgi:hypothetical protein
VTSHIPGQVGTHDAEGWRTHTTPGDVCLGCSDADAGRWVPVSECPTALATYELERSEWWHLEEEALRYLASLRNEGEVSERE